VDLGEKYPVQVQTLSDMTNGDGVEIRNSEPTGPQRMASLIPI
jgi:hypothetical protein